MKCYNFELRKRTQYDRLSQQQLGFLFTYDTVNYQLLLHRLSVRFVCIVSFWLGFHRILLADHSRSRSKVRRRCVNFIIIIIYLPMNKTQKHIHIHMHKVGRTRRQYF